MDEYEINAIVERLKKIGSNCEMFLMLDTEGEISAGFAKKGGVLEELKPCDDLFNGKRILQGLTSISLVKVSSSPGHWCIKAGRLSWCP